MKINAIPYICYYQEFTEHYRDPYSDMKKVFPIYTVTQMNLVSKKFVILVIGLNYQINSSPNLFPIFVSE